MKKSIKRVSLSSCSNLVLTLRAEDNSPLGVLSFQTSDSGLTIFYQSDSKSNSIALDELREAILLLAEHLKNLPKECY